MRVDRRKYLLTFAGAAALLSTGAAALWRRARRVLSFPYLGGPLSEADYAALAARPGWRGSILDAGGVKLRGLARSPGRPDAPHVLFFSGNSATLLSDGQLFLDALLEKEGWGAFVWAYRGYDGNPGESKRELLEQDGWAAFQKIVKEEGVRRERVHVVAFSLGTAIALATAARAGGDAPGSVTLLAPFTALEMRAGQAAPDPYESTGFLANVRAPVLILHGSDDKTLPKEGGRLIADGLGARARYVELPGNGHLDLLQSPGALAETRAFIASHSH